MTQLGAMVVVQQDGNVLLTKREDFEIWCLPGGAVESGEAPDVAAVREVREETGLEVQLTRLVALIARSDAGRMLLVFAATPVGGGFVPDPHEVIDLRFFAADALPEPLMLDHGQMIAETFRGSSGQVWQSRRRMPPQFADRAALYRWRDESGLSRPEAYLAFTRMMGDTTLTCVVGSSIP